MKIDHVFVGVWDGAPKPDPNEVAGWEWRGADALDRSVREHPELFSPWLPLAWSKVKDRLAGIAAS